MIARLNLLDGPGIEKVRKVFEQYDLGEISFIGCRLQLAKVWNDYKLSPDYVCALCAEGKTVYNKLRAFIDDLS